MDKASLVSISVSSFFLTMAIAHTADAQLISYLEGSPGIALRLEKKLQSPIELQEKKLPISAIDYPVETKLLEEVSQPLKLAGYVKTLLMHSKTADQEENDYTLSLYRLRLKATYEVPSRFQLHVEHDTEARIGSYLKTGAFQREKNAPAQQYWRADSGIADERNYYVIQRLYRAYARFTQQDADLTIGRQRIPLGTGRFWSALDMLNPLNPIQIERDEYVGVDAGLLEYKISALSKLALIYAPDPSRSADRWIGQYRTNIQGTDFTFTQGKYWRDSVTGLDFTTQIDQTGTGIHGEVTYVNPEFGSPYQKTLLGVDHQFPNTLGISAEIYYSSQHREDRLTQFARNPQLLQLQPFDKFYVGLAPSYEFTPLIKITSYFLFNMSDHSRFFYPSLSYAISDNLNIAGGVQIFEGNNDSEYGEGKNLIYGQIQWFF